MKKTLLASAALAFALGISSAAMADQRRDPAEISASPADTAQCSPEDGVAGAGSGAFGYLSGDNNPSDPTFGANDGKIGANGPATGNNNSGLCGDPNDVLPN